MIKIKKDSSEYRMWLKHRNEKNLLLRTRKKEHKKAKARRQNEYNRLLKQTTSYNVTTKKYEFVAPSSFSLVNNTDKTIRFFSDIIKFISDNRNYGKHIFIDISRIESLTTDALMYLLAIVNNLNEQFRGKYSFSGNAPANKNVRKKFEESGFYNFVNYRSKEPITTNTDNLQIIAGSICDPIVARQISDFASEKLNISFLQCKFLFEIMIELMSNSQKHAYNESPLLPHWYCYSEYEKGSIYFTFMDTGVGIPSTVKKKFIENLDIFNFKEDSKYVISALDGENRTATNKPYRGKGMPKIRKFCSQGKIEHMKIITNKANVSVLKTKYESEDMRTALIGTLYHCKINANFIEGV